MFWVAVYAGMHDVHCPAEHRITQHEGVNCQVALASTTATITYCQLSDTAECAADPFAIHQVCLQWLRTVIHPRPFILTIDLPQLSHTESQAEVHLSQPRHQQPVQTKQQNLTDKDTTGSLHQPGSIICQAVSEVMGLCHQLDHPTLCPCHGRPASQAHQQASDSLCCCPVTGACLDRASLEAESGAVQVYVFSLLCCLEALRYSVKHRSSL